MSCVRTAHIHRKRRTEIETQKDRQTDRQTDRDRGSRRRRQKENQRVTDVDREKDRERQEWRRMLSSPGGGPAMCRGMLHHLCWDCLRNTPLLQTPSRYTPCTTLPRTSQGRVLPCFTLCSTENSKKNKKNTHTKNNNNHSKNRTTTTQSQARARPNVTPNNPRNYKSSSNNKAKVAH